MLVSPEDQRWACQIWPSAFHQSHLKNSQCGFLWALQHCIPPGSQFCLPKLRQKQESKQTRRKLCVLHGSSVWGNLFGCFDELLSSNAITHTANLKHNWEKNQYKERESKWGKQSRKTRGQALMNKFPFFLQLGKLRHNCGRCFQAAQTCIRGREAQASLTLFGSITRGHIFRWMIWSWNILQCNEYKQAFLLYLSQLCISLLPLVFNARSSLARAAESRSKLSSGTTSAPMSHQSRWTETAQTKAFCSAREHSRHHCPLSYAASSGCLAQRGASVSLIREKGLYIALTQERTGCSQQS